MIITSFQTKRDCLIASTADGGSVVWSKSLACPPCMLPWTPGGEEIRKNAVFTRKFALKTAGACLARSARTRKELLAYLTERSVPESSAVETADELTRLGLTGDEKFAELFVSSRADMGWGREKILRKLTARGISGSTARAALEEFYTAGQESENLRGYAQAQADRLTGLLASEKREKIIRRCRLRGFALSDSLRAAREAVFSPGQDAEDAASAALDRRIARMIRKKLTREEMLPKLLREFYGAGLDEDFIAERLSTYVLGVE